MAKTIRIGTRDSKLALWQAENVSRKLNDLGFRTQIIPIKSEGDIILDKPLYELGITGIFTKTLDIAMISGKVDIAVHSMKDVPTTLPKGIVQAAVLTRANSSDILVHKGNLDFLKGKGIVATGSLRRKALWLHQYPDHTTEDLRGNVNTRLQKLQNNNWDGAVFAAAGLERLNIKPENSVDLDWMIPAPAQGAMVVVAMENDDFSLEALSKLNDQKSEIETYIERQFLKTLEGGCTAPIGALAKFSEDETCIHFKGILLSLDGKQKFEVDQTISAADWKESGCIAAKQILENGGEALMNELRQQLKK